MSETTTSVVHNPIGLKMHSMLQNGYMHSALCSFLVIEYVLGGPGSRNHPRFRIGKPVELRLRWGYDDPNTIKESAGKRCLS